MKSVFPMLALAAVAWCGEPLTQQEQDELWRKAMEESERARQATSIQVPVRAVPIPDPNAVGMSERRAREKYWNDQHIGVVFNAQRMTVEEMDAEGARILAEHESRKKQQEEAYRQQLIEEAEVQRREDEAERVREAKREAEWQQQQATKAAERAVGGFIICAVLFIVSFIPWSAAAIRGCAQSPAVAILGLSCSACLITRYIAGPLAEVSLLGLAVLMWVGGFVVAVWKRPAAP